MGQMWLTNVFLFCGVILMCKLKTFHAKCGGKTEIKDVLNGNITLGLGTNTYPPNTHCEWLIRAPLPGQHIQLTFKVFDTECSFDYLKIFDGSSTSAKLLGSFSGDTLPPVIVSNSSAILINFFSDNNYVRTGWRIDFTISNCSGNCSGHGNCVGNTCNCDDLYTGDACDVYLCPQMCNNITGHGKCSKLIGKCTCNPGYIDQSCSFSLQNQSDVGVWHLIKQQSSVFHARFGHAGVYVKQNSALWVFGGSNLNVFFDDLVKFDFVKNEWFLVNSSGPSPVARFRHTLVLYKDTLILFGGEITNGTLVNDLWSFNMSSIKWQLLRGSGIGSPPGLASHTANVVGDKLIIFGGRSKEHGFSYDIYTYDLSLTRGWEKVIYKLGKNSALRLVGHSSIYYPALKSLVIFGGFRQVSSRIHKKINDIYLYHVEHKVWLEITDVHAASSKYVPPPMAYHSSVVVGDYMLVYGGNVHTHSFDETCFGSNIYLFNLKFFTWISPLLLTVLGLPTNSSWQPKRGRFSFVASVFKGNTMLVAGGFNGNANGDLLAYKLPSNIVSGNLTVSTTSGIHCQLYNEKECGLDPFCVWCNSNLNCLSIHQKDSCSVMLSSYTAHMCHAFVQCASCLTWGSQPGLLCGWCVQDSRCYPRGSPSGTCSPHANIRGWWGNGGTFLTVVNECRTKDYPPGLTIKVFYYKWADTPKLDRILLMNPLRATFDGSVSSYFVRVQMIGFIYPFLSLPINRNVEIKIRISKTDASLHLSTDVDPSNTEKVISKTNNMDGVTLLSNMASRKNITHPLFPNPMENKMYYMEVKTQLPQNDKDVKLWVYMDGKLLNGSYVRPFFSNSCSGYISCLECLSDASCGWCSASNTCVHRNSSTTCSHVSGEVVYLILNATFCETCNQYMDCDSCSSGSDCVWLLAQYCDRVGSASKTETCKQPCYSYNNCGSCVLNRQCLWCGNRQKCLPWFSYRPDHLHGQCSHWSDRDTVNGQCPDCSSRNKCEDCIKERYCGWCGEYHNGRCFDGEFDGPYNGQCEQLMFSNNTETNSNSSLWSYTKCPDENECITKKDCHSNATCTNHDPGYKCECRIGFEGNGYHCNVSCNPPCVYGKCNSLLTCDCDLGWSGNVCSIDCGCNNHSTCHKNIGVCDRCQDFTYGKHCEFCLPGSYGNATTNLGCRKCECNGHVDERRGICDGKTGHCFCLNNTMGKHCNECLPGFVGHPQKGGGCYYPCEAHSFLWNITHGALSTTVGSGTADIENTNCVWIITTLRNQSEHIVFSNEHATGTITFRIKDLHVDCQTDHLYIYEGLPPYNLTSFALTSDSSFNQIASLCGFDASSVPTIETRTGTLVIVFKGNIGNNSSTNGFNATFVINQCPNSCTGNRYCFSNALQEKCVCKTGWTGPGCDQVICPANCSEELGHGYCDKVYGTCVCKEGFAGESCSTQNPFGNFTWELIDNISGRDSTLPRMGHTMIADERTQSLLIYGGYSFRYGILGNIWIYNITKRNVIRIPDDNEGPSPRYLHAAAVYKRQMYISGGITQQDFSSELWKFDLDSKKWTKLQNLLRRVAGHTVNVVNDTMYLIGGYTRDEYCSTKVYILELDLNSSWSDLNPSGDTLNVCFGHTTVYDQQLQSLIVFGKESDRTTATLAVLQLSANKWTVVPVQLQSYSRYFHLSMIVGDVMIVSGGYTGGSVQEFSDITLVYNIRCGQWETLDLKGIFPLALAHSSIASINGEIYGFGGYNGIASEELFRLNISSDWCSMFSTKSKCISIGGCNWCFDKTLNRSFCYTPDDSASQACSNNTIPGNQCNADHIAMPLSSALTSSSDLCSQYSICSSCIQAKGYKSGSCFWAINSGQCLSVYFQPIMCVFGICGRVLREYDACPGQCQRASYCYDCLKQYNCAWCADPLENGNGTCMEGTFQGPLNGTCQKKNKNVESTSLVWVSSVCLLEDECRNNHHKCNENETCLNLEYKYECPCKVGYTEKSSKCVPVCTQGCGNGDCIDPDFCLCLFGWVGSNCTTACHCYGQGNCVDENQLNNCTDCRNHTAGVSCERCVRGFVGQNGVCSPCYDRCNHNAEQCYSVDDYNIITGSDSTKELSLLGPRSDNDFICQCRNNSTGAHCETCHAGYFKLKKERKCEQCRCRGHASTCTSNTGLDCNCKNNTKVPPYCTPSTINCYKEQCSFCEMNYFGNPRIEGQQCYLTMRILQRSSLARENSGNSRLFSEQTNFFYVYPSYTNADIRLTFDVFDGSIDVYIATVENAFKVRTDQNISISQKVSHSELYSDGLNTYTTFSGDSTVAVITAINRKLVVTFPFEEHQLEDKKFYIVTKAGHSGAYGIVYFKQDNSKIDLVVFFAVFFSCFFLLLSVIVIGWSIKHHIHSRQEVHDSEVRRVRLQSRPFAKFSFLFEYHPPSRNIIRHRKTTGSTRKAIQALGVQSTFDNHAAVSTVMFQLPQTEKTKMSLVLGTTLTIVSPQQHNKLSQTSPKMSPTTMETENL